MNWAKVVCELEKMSALGLREAERFTGEAYHNRQYRENHRARGLMAGVMGDALTAGLSGDEVHEYIQLHADAEEVRENVKI